MVRALALVLALLLAGCAPPLLRGEAEPVQRYFLPVDPQPAPEPPADAPVLMVSLPAAAPGFETSRMAYSQAPFQVRYFARNEWAGELPRVVHPLLVSALQSPGQFRVVSGEIWGASPDLRLDVQIVSLFQDFTSEPSQAVVQLRAQLIDSRRGTLLDSAEFAGTETAPSDDPPGGVTAVHQLLGRLFDEIAGFAAAAVPSQPLSGPRVDQQPHARKVQGEN